MKLSMVHLVFYVSMLRKFLGDPNIVVPLDDMRIEENLTYKDVLVMILDLKVKRLRNKEVVFVKALWGKQQVESAT